MAYKKTLRVALAAAAVASFAVPALAADDLRYFAGRWGCHSQSDHITPAAAEFGLTEILQIFNLKVTRYGNVSGFLIQEQVGDETPAQEIRCDITGSASTGSLPKGYVSFDLDLQCDVPGEDQPVQASGAAECVGVHKKLISGFQGMYCLDMEDEEGFELEAIALCERQ